MKNKINFYYWENKKHFQTEWPKNKLFKRMNFKIKQQKQNQAEWKEWLTLTKNESSMRKSDPNKHKIQNKIER